jgi:hypothetical protein
MQSYIQMAEEEAQNSPVPQSQFQWLITLLKVADSNFFLLDLEYSGGLWTTHPIMDVFLSINALLITAKNLADDWG